jgi:hypothetical protein
MSGVSIVLSGCVSPDMNKALGVAMNDLLYVGLTIAVFFLLALLIKGVERFGGGKRSER